MKSWDNQKKAYLDKYNQTRNVKENKESNLDSVASSPQVKSIKRTPAKKEKKYSDWIASRTNKKEYKITISPSMRDQIMMMEFKELQRHYGYEECDDEIVDGLRRLNTDAESPGESPSKWRDYPNLLSEHDVSKGFDYERRDSFLRVLNTPNIKEIENLKKKNKEILDSRIEDAKSDKSAKKETFKEILSK